MNPIYRTILSLSVVSPLLLFFLVGYSSRIVDWMNGFIPASWGLAERHSQAVGFYHPWIGSCLFSRLVVSFHSNKVCIGTRFRTYSPNHD